MTKKYLPVACSLPARESRDQIGEWQALGEHRVRVDPVEGGYSVVFDSDVADTVEDLARREAACCGFLDIVSTPVEDGLRLVMTSENPDARPVIEMLVGVQKS